MDVSASNEREEHASFEVSKKKRLKMYEFTPLGSPLLNYELDIKKHIHVTFVWLPGHTSEQCSQLSHSLAKMGAAYPGMHPWTSSIELGYPVDPGPG